MQYTENEIIEIMYKSFKLFWNKRAKYHNDNVYLYDVFDEYYLTINRHVMTALLNKINTNHKILPKDRKYFNVFNFDTVFKNMHVYNWLTYDIILRAVNLGQNINNLPERYLTNEIKSFLI